MRIGVKQRLIAESLSGRFGGSMGEVKAVSDADFESAVNADEWVLVDFWAPWCGPCKALGPVLEQVAADSPVTIAKVNTDTDSMNAARLGVRGIPALFLFHNGQMVANETGMVPKPALMAWLNQHMATENF